MFNWDWFSNVAHPTFALFRSAPKVLLSKSGESKAKLLEFETKWRGFFAKASDHMAKPATPPPFTPSTLPSLTSARISKFLFNWPILATLVALHSTLLSHSLSGQSFETGVASSLAIFFFCVINYDGKNGINWDIVCHFLSSLHKLKCIVIFWVQDFIRSLTLHLFGYCFHFSWYLVDANWPGLYIFIDFSQYLVDANWAGWMPEVLCRHDRRVTTEKFATCLRLTAHCSNTFPTV